MNRAWDAFVEQDRRLTAPPHLEGRVHEALRQRSPEPSSHRRVVIFTAAAAAIVLAAVSMPRPDPPPAPPPVLEARALPAAPLAAAVDQRPAGGSDVREPAPPDEPVMMFVIFDAEPVAAHEPLQLVRLRVPQEALLALGLPPWDPDAAGLVDIGMLVGEDGLPRHVQRIRLDHQEERR